MAVAAEERTRCALCGKWIDRRPDWYGALSEQEVLDDTYQDHVCDPGMVVFSSAEQEARARCKLSVDSVSRRRVRVCDLVGPQEIAERLAVKVQTVRVWRWRDLMPAPQAVISGVPVWDWAEVERWAISTGRLSGPPPA
jgi:hypothetical protein